MASHDGFETTIPSLMAQLNELVADNFNSDTSTFKSVHARTEFTLLTTQLGVLSRNPAENVSYLLAGTIRNSAVRCAIGLRIFELVPAGADETASVPQLASAAGADPLLVERLMRVLASRGIFAQRDDDLYAHNDLSRCFISQHHRHLFQEGFDWIGKGAYALPEYLEAAGWKNPESYEKSAISVALGVPVGFWDFLAASPERQALFSSAMQSRHGAMEITDLYPFGEELGGVTGQGADSDEEVTLVDVGGGRGHTLIQIKEAFPSVQGKFILQDQEAVIQDAKSNGLPDYIEAQAASFFEPNPVVNARAYLFRRILHDWSDPYSVKILSNTVAAMGEHSKILIADVEMPVRDTPVLVTSLDWSMMALGGIERTQRHWETLLGKVGLKVVKVWRAANSYHVVIEGQKMR